ncbi:MAG: cytochrome P450 [Candidatus Binatia bacterium]
MDYNPSSPAVQQNPYPYYAYLRQHAPVYQIPDVGFWAVSRYQDVLSILKNPQVFSSAAHSPTMFGESNPFPPGAPAMIGTDPPDHTRLRKLVNRAFTPRRINALEHHMRAVARDLIEQATANEFDLMNDLADPLPVSVIAGLLGVPPERHRDFKRWADDLVLATNGAAVTPEERTGIRQSIAEWHAHFQAAIAAYRLQPGDNLISDLVRAEEENQTLTGEEVLSMALLVLLGGADTTTHLIGNAIEALLNHPQQLAQVRENLELVSQVVEETLRYDAPVQVISRQATQAVEVAGTAIPAGAMLYLVLGAANRDERKFADPERFDITRNTDGQIDFGFGIHFCLGAQVARLEAKAALEELLQRFPRLSRKDGQSARVESPILRGFKTFPLTYNLQ